jgi:hypothetical protein
MFLWQPLHVIYCRANTAYWLGYYHGNRRLLFTVGQNHPQGVASFKYKSYVDIYLNHLVDFHEIWKGGNTFQGDLDAVIFIPIVSNILKLLRFKFVR